MLEYLNFVSKPHTSRLIYHNCDSVLIFSLHRNVHNASLKRKVVNAVTSGSLAALMFTGHKREQKMSRTCEIVIQTIQISIKASRINIKYEQLQRVRSIRTIICMLSFLSPRNRDALSWSRPRCCLTFWNMMLLYCERILAYFPGKNYRATPCCVCSTAYLV